MPTALALASHHSFRRAFPSQFLLPGDRPVGMLQSSLPSSSRVQGMPWYAGSSTRAYAYSRKALLQARRSPPCRRSVLSGGTRGGFRYASIRAKTLHPRQRRPRGPRAHTGYFWRCCFPAPDGSQGSFPWVEVSREVMREVMRLTRPAPGRCDLRPTGGARTGRKGHAHRS